LQPDATFLFDLDPAIAFERQRAQSRTPDKFEREQADFFVRVREAYLERARRHRARIHVIDASGDVDAVRARLAEKLEKVLA
jgi:dTMP kinase